MASDDKIDVRTLDLESSESDQQLDVTSHVTSEATVGGEGPRPTSPAHTSPNVTSAPHSPTAAQQAHHASNNSEQTSQPSQKTSPDTGENQCTAIPSSDRNGDLDMAGSCLDNRAECGNVHDKDIDGSCIESGTACEEKEGGKSGDFESDGEQRCAVQDAVDIVTCEKTSDNEGVRVDGDGGKSGGEEMKMSADLDGGKCEVDVTDNVDLIADTDHLLQVFNESPIKSPLEESTAAKADELAMYVKEGVKQAKDQVSARDSHKVIPDKERGKDEDKIENVSNSNNEIDIDPKTKQGVLENDNEGDEVDIDVALNKSGEDSDIDIEGDEYMDDYEDDEIDFLSDIEIRVGDETVHGEGALLDVEEECENIENVETSEKAEICTENDSADIPNPSKRENEKVSLDEQISTSKHELNEKFVKGDIKSHEEVNVLLDEAIEEQASDQSEKGSSEIDVENQAQTDDDKDSQTESMECNTNNATNNLNESVKKDSLVLESNNALDLESEDKEQVHVTNDRKTESKSGHGLNTESDDLVLESDGLVLESDDGFKENTDDDMMLEGDDELVLESREEPTKASTVKDDLVKSTDGLVLESNDDGMVLETDDGLVLESSEETTASTNLTEDPAKNTDGLVLESTDGMVLETDDGLVLENKEATTPTKNVKLTEDPTQKTDELVSKSTNGMILETDDGLVLESEEQTTADLQLNSKQQDAANKSGSDDDLVLESDGLVLESSPDKEIQESVCDEDMVLESADTEGTSGGRMIDSVQDEDMILESAPNEDEETENNDGAEIKSVSAQEINLASVSEERASPAGKAAQKEKEKSSMSVIGKKKVIESNYENSAGEHPLKSIVSGHEMLTKLLSTITSIPEKGKEREKEKLPEPSKLKSLLDGESSTAKPSADANAQKDCDVKMLELPKGVTPKSPKEVVNILGDFTIDIDDLELESDQVEHIKTELSSEIFDIELRVDKDKTDEAKLKETSQSADTVILEHVKLQSMNEPYFDLTDHEALNRELVEYGFDASDPTTCFDLTDSNVPFHSKQGPAEPEFIDLDEINDTKEELQSRRKSLDVSTSEQDNKDETSKEKAKTQSSKSPQPASKSSKSPKPPKSPKSPRSPKQASPLPEQKPLIPPYNPVIPRMPITSIGTSFIESSVARFYCSVKKELYPSANEPGYNPYLRHPPPHPHSGMFYPDLESFHDSPRPPGPVRPDHHMYDPGYQHSQMLQFMAHRNHTPAPPVHHRPQRHPYGGRYPPPWLHPYMRPPPPRSAPPPPPPPSMARPPQMSRPPTSTQLLPPPPPLQRRPDLPQHKKTEHPKPVQNTSPKPPALKSTTEVKPQVTEMQIPTPQLPKPIVKEADGSGQKEFKCETCGKSFSKFQILRFHCRTHAMEAEEKGLSYEPPTDPNEFKPSVPPRVVGTVEPKINPPVMIEEQAYNSDLVMAIKCKYCNLALMNKQTYKKHIQRRHKQVNPSMLKSILDDPNLIGLHSPIPCSVCGLKLATPKTLRVHMKRKHPNARQRNSLPPAPQVNVPVQNKTLNQTLVPYMSAEEQMVSNRKEFTNHQRYEPPRPVVPLNVPFRPQPTLRMHPSLLQIKKRIRKVRPKRKCKFCHMVLVNFQVLKKHVRRKHAAVLGLIDNPRLELTPELIALDMVVDEPAPSTHVLNKTEVQHVQDQIEALEEVDVKPIIVSETSLSAASSAASLEAFSISTPSESSSSSPMVFDTKTDITDSSQSSPLAQLVQVSSISEPTSTEPTSTPGLVYCNICAVPFASSKTLRYHRARKHPEVVMRENAAKGLGAALFTPASQRPIKCKYCYRVLVNRQILKRHLYRKHPDVAEEAIAELTSETANAPKASATPIGETSLNTAPVDCNVCGKTLSNSQVLRKHLRRMHAADLGIRALPPSKNPVECKLCGLILGYKGNLKKHIVRKHPTAIDTADEEALAALCESMAAIPIPKAKLEEFMQKEEELEIMKQNTRQSQVAKKSTSKMPRSWHQPIPVVDRDIEVEDHKYDVTEDDAVNHGIKENQDGNQRSVSTEVEGVKMVSATERFLALQASGVNLEDLCVDKDEDYGEDSSTIDDGSQAMSYDSDDEKLVMRPHVILTDVLPFYEKMKSVKKTVGNMDDMESDLDISGFEDLDMPDDDDLVNQIMTEDIPLAKNVVKLDIEENSSSTLDYSESNLSLKHDPDYTSSPSRRLTPQQQQKKRLLKFRQKREENKCTVCDKKFGSKAYLQVHQRLHSGSQPNKCPKCSQTFTLASSLARHLIDFHQHKTQFSCKTCGKHFMHKRSVRIHRLIHSGALPYKCGFCDKAFALRCFRTKHETIHSEDKPYACMFCEKRFRKKSHCEEHQLTHSIKRPHRCGVCGRCFPFSSYIRIHHQICHSDHKPYECTVCKKKFSISQGLRMHMVVHTKAKNFKCKLCDRYFAYHGSLQYHMRSTHTHERPYSCSVCNKTFPSQSYMKIHERIHTGEKPYACKLCSKTFAQQPHLTAHMNFHLGKRPFKCKECGRGFTQSSHLRTHQKIHTGERPYSCKICKKSFAHTGTMKSHMRQHTGEKPYQCAACPAVFTQIHALKLHQATSGHRTPGLTQLKPMPCPNCSKVFYFTAALRKHMQQRHSGAKQYQCTCGKSFFAKESLKNHKCHDAPPQHKCEECGRMFSHMSTLTRHMNTFHVADREDPVFKCQICDQVYGTKRTLKIHLANDHSPGSDHSQQLKVSPQPAAARIVSKSVALLQARSEPIKCKYCPLMLATEKTLKFHIMRKHPEGHDTLPVNLRRQAKKMNTRCEFCGKKFSTHANMKRHVDQLHWDEKDDW